MPIYANVINIELIGGCVVVFNWFYIPVNGRVHTVIDFNRTLCSQVLIDDVVDSFFNLHLIVYFVIVLIINVIKLFHVFNRGRI